MILQLLFVTATGLLQIMLLLVIEINKFTQSHKRLSKDSLIAPWCLLMLQLGLGLLAMGEDKGPMFNVLLIKGNVVCDCIRRRRTRRCSLEKGTADFLAFLFLSKLMTATNLFQKNICNEAVPHFSQVSFLISSRG